eukprot:Clim_evm14s40 gene=Clim_evmTU14s40
MLLWKFVITVLALLSAGLSAGLSINRPLNADKEPFPIVLWHGMGDTCCNKQSMGMVKKYLEEKTGAYVVALMIGESPGKDQSNGFFMNANEQIEVAAKQIKEDPKLQCGFNALGFSQGGQFLRAYVQRFNDPPVHNLITIGGQHQGVDGVPSCPPDASGFKCSAMKSVIKAAAYTSFAQNHFTQANYWHDPLREKDYKANCQFLPDINNENKHNQDYIDRLQSLNKFVMVKFSNDTVVIPKESEWFGFYAPGQDKDVLKLQDTDLYKKDQLGLKKMDEHGQLVFLETPGNHMQLDMDVFEKKVLPYLM